MGILRWEDSPTDLEQGGGFLHKEIFSSQAFLKETIVHHFNKRRGCPFKITWHLQQDQFFFLKGVKNVKIGNENKVFFPFEFTTKCQSLTKAL